MQQRFFFIFLVVMASNQYSCAMDLRRHVLQKNFDNRQQGPVQVKQPEKKQAALSMFYAYVARGGDLKKMKDFGIMKSYKNENGIAEKFTLGIFDGDNGGDAAEYAAKHLHAHLTTMMEKYDCEVEEACVKAFQKVDKHIMQSRKLAKQGTTAAVVAVDKFKAVFSWVGDSRAILMRAGKVIFSTTDHKPDNPVEKERIEKTGGNITWSGSPRCSRVNGVLATSRILGRVDLKPYVSSIPEIATCDLQVGDVIMLASDGLWNVMSNDEVAHSLEDSFERQPYEVDRRFPIAPYLRDNQPDQLVFEDASDMKLGLAARILRDEAYLRGSTGNVSVILAKIQG